ncbi:MAG TPA: G8 domain-containing protein, partial [Methanomassiliicoccales archaeon]|nr:G8 domain-containing protein [Methanomassiliicoccales archaeon]
MAEIHSAGTGNWHTPGTWTGGVVPGTGDTAVVDAGHTVTIAADVNLIYKIIVYGNLVMNADITMDNSNGCYIWVTDNG